MGKSWLDGLERCNPKVAGSSLRPAGIVGEGCEYTALSPSSLPRRDALEQGTEPPTAPRAPQHKWLPTTPGVCSQYACVFTAVCVYIVWVKCRAKIPKMGHHTWSYVLSLVTWCCACSQTWEKYKSILPFQYSIVNSINGFVKQLFTFVLSNVTKSVESVLFISLCLSRELNPWPLSC